MAMNNETGSWIDWLAMALVIIGALNWGLVGLGSLFETNLNLVNLLFGFSQTLEAIVYLIVGLAALYAIFFLVQLRSHRHDTV